MSVLEAAKKHFKEGRQCLEVPEWGEGPNKPLKVYCTPLTLGEKKKIAKFTDDNNEGTARVVILKATNANGDPLFEDEDLPQLMRNVDSAVLERICLWISMGVDLSAADDYVEESAGN